MNTEESTAPGGSRLRSLSNVGKARFAAFTVVALALLALNVALTPPEVLSAAFVGWAEAFGSHQIHDMTVAAMLWMALIVPVALLLYHPTARVNTILAPIVLVVPVAVMAFLAESFLFTGFLIGSVLAVLALLLHPAGRSLARLDRVADVDPKLAGLYAVGAIALLGYAGLELIKQLGPMNEHVVFVHFGGMAIAGIYVVIMGGLAVFRQRDWRFAAWSAGIVAAFVGAASVVYPAVESSLGTVGGALLILWAVAFVIAVELARRDVIAEDDTLDDRVGRPA